MDKKKSTAIQYVILVVLALLIALLMWYIMARSSYNIDETYAPDLTLVDNPLMGFAPDAANPELCEKSRLVFIPVTFAEWEPQEGTFAIKELEEKYNLKRWKSEGKHAVLKFMCDVPSEEEHMDIPDWLYEKTGTGWAYDTEMGKGFCPDYADATFIRYHKEAVEKLAEYCNKDFFVSFVELGSLGHWGEWHCKDNEGNTLMPDARICEDYATLYSESFVNARLLARRNYETVVAGNIGFYNDMLGNTEETADWLRMLQRGGEQETSGEPLKLKNLVAFGKTEPVGGEFTSDVPMEEILGDGLGQTLADISASKMTFIGPMVPDLADPQKASAVNSMLRRCGYRLYVSKLHTAYVFSKTSMDIEVTLKNAGSAGFFFDWPVTLTVFDKNKEQVFWEGLMLDLRELGKSDEITATSRVEVSDRIKDEFYIGISITDYEGKDPIKLAIDTGSKQEFIGDSQIIYHYVGK